MGLTKLLLTKEQAIDCIAVDDGMVHCFLSSPGMLIGADWDMEDVKETIEKAKPEWIEISGPSAKAMKHAVAVYSEKAKDYCFFESNMEKIEQIEAEAK